MIARVWDRAWWKDESPYNLAGARIVVAAHALWILLSRDFPAMSNLPAPFWSSVAESARWRFLIFPGQAEVETVVQWLAVAALTAVIVGWHARAGAALAALLLYHLTPLETIHWTPNPYERGFEVSILALVVLAASPCASVWSLGRTARAWPSPAPDFRWPVVLIRLFVAQIYLFSGYAKLFRVGLDWVSAENMSRWLLLFAQHEQLLVPTQLGAWIADRPALAFLVAAGAVGLDLSFITTPFSRVARRVLVPAACLLHAGIFLVMSIAFLNAPQLLVFVNWGWLRSRFGRTVHGSQVAATSMGS